MLLHFDLTNPVTEASAKRMLTDSEAAVTTFTGPSLDVLHCTGAEHGL
jgi:hypothetical protein